MLLVMMSKCAVAAAESWQLPQEVFHTWAAAVAAVGWLRSAGDCQAVLAPWQAAQSLTPLGMAGNSTSA